MSSNQIPLNKKQKQWGALIVLVLLFLFFTRAGFFFLLVLAFMMVALAFQYKRNPAAFDTIKTLLHTLQEPFKTRSAVPPSRPSSPFNTPYTSPMESVPKKSHKKIFFLGVGVAVAFVFLMRAIAIVPVGHTGVYHLFGNVKNEPLLSGFHVINPFGSVEMLNVQTQDYTMSIAAEEGNYGGDDSITALTKEGLNVGLDITVLYHLMSAQAPQVYKNIGLDYSEIVIRPEIRSTIREVAADYEAKDIYSEKRAEVTQKLLNKLTERINPRGIQIEEVLLRNVDLPVNLAQSIEQKLQAEQESQRYEFVLQTEEKEAERKRIEAAGQRDAQKIISEGLTTEYLNYLYVQGLKDRAGTIYVPVSPENGVPLFRGL